VCYHIICPVEYLRKLCVSYGLWLWTILTERTCLFSGLVSGIRVRYSEGR